MGLCYLARHSKDYIICHTGLYDYRPFVIILEAQTTQTHLEIAELFNKYNANTMKRPHTGLTRAAAIVKPSPPVD